MKRSKIFKTVFFLFLLIATERFCRFQTKSFSILKATTSYVYPFSATFSQERPKELDQTFRFLGSGVQSYAFLGEDGKTVIKLFKHYHMGLPTDLVKKFLPKKLAVPLLQKREKRMEHLFQSGQIAHNILEKETGVFYTHLAKTKSSLGSITLYDPLNVAHHLNLDQTEFLLQKRAEPLCQRLHFLFRSQKIAEALQAMEQLLTLVENRSKKGIKNKDGNILENCGFIEDSPVEIDIGSYVYRRRSTSPNPHKKAVLKAKLQLLHFVKKNYPENLTLCKESLLSETLD